MKGTGRTTRRMGSEYIYTPMTHVMRGSGKMISNMARGKSPGLMVRFMKGSTVRGKSMGMGF